MKHVFKINFFSLKKIILWFYILAIFVMIIS